MNKFKFKTKIKKDAIINTNVWPAKILADKRIAKLKDRTIYEKTSININKGINGKGASGIKTFKKSNLKEIKLE